MLLKMSLGGKRVFLLALYKYLEKYSGLITVFTFGYIKINKLINRQSPVFVSSPNLRTVDFSLFIY